MDSGIPMFGKNGTALSSEERATIAKRRGLCVRCGTKTHQVKVLGRSGLTNKDVYHGICIRCNPDAVPVHVFTEWQSRQAPTAAVQPVRDHHGGNRFKAAGNAMRYVQRNQPNRRISPPPPAGVNPELSPYPQPGVTRKGSSKGNDMYGRPRVDEEPVLNANGHNRRKLRPTRSGSDGDNHRYPNHSNSAQQHPTPPSSHPQQHQHQHPHAHYGSSKSPQNGYENEEYKSSADLDSWTLIKELKENRDKPDVLRIKLHGFRNLAEDQAGALFEIKDLMDLYRNDARFMMVAIGAVWGIIANSMVKKLEAVSTGCLDIVIDSLRGGSARDYAPAVHWSLGTLVSIAHLEENKGIVAEKGGIEVIVDALNRHTSNPTVFEWGCRALHAIITDEEPGGSHERDMITIEEANGIKAVCAAMKQHIPESGALWWAFKLLFRLQDRNETPAVQRVIRRICDEDMASTCTKILKARSTNLLVFEQACEILCLLISTNSSSRQTAVESISTVTLVMSDNPSKIELLGSCARLLTSLARNNPQVKRQISDGSSVRVLVQAMKQNSGEVEFIEASTTLLWSLSSDGSSFDFSILDEAKAVLEDAASAYPHAAGLSRAICGFVANVASVVEGDCKNIPVEAVLKICSSATDPAVCQLATSTVSVICGKFPETSDLVVQSGLCNRLLEGLCDPNVDVQSSSSSALASIVSESVAAKNSVVESGGLATVSAALLITESDKLAESLLYLISAVVTGGQKKVIQLPNEIIQAILQAMRSFPSLFKVSCSTIRNAMLVTVPGFTSLNVDGLIEMLTSIIDDPTQTDGVVVEACGALWSYLAKQPNQNVSVSSLLFQSVLGLCARHRGDANPASFNSVVLTEAAGALASLMYCIRENPIHLPDNDIDLIVAILDLVIECDVDNVQLMDRMLDVILTLCFLARDVLIQFGVIVVVIDCMVEHEIEEQIQQKGCTILALLASTENLQVNLSIAETDGIDMIVSALAGFADNLTIQTDACRALSHLSIDHESRMLISSQGGLILLVNAMGRHRNDADLLEAACSALLNLSSDAEEQVLASSNVVDTVIETMRQQIMSPKLQEKSLGVLQNVSMRSRDAKRAIADAGGITAVALSIKEFMGSPAVLERAFTTLWSLAVLDDNQVLIANEGGIGLVVNGMMANITYEKVQKQACGCLCTLSSNSRNKTLIRDLGGVDSIVYAMWAHYNSDALLIEACRALSSLAVNVQTNEVMIATDGEIGAIMSAMKRFPQSERLQEHACVALRNFLLSADNAALVRHQADDLERLMNAASTRFPDRCAERARQVLASIR